MLAVAATDSWNPTDHTSAGSSTSRTTTAPARIEPVLLGRPSRTPISASPAITPARITDGSAPVSTTKNATVPIPSANRGHRDHPSAAPSASDRREHHRDVLARDHEQVREPGRTEVAFETGIEPGIVAEREPHQQPGLARRERGLDRAAGERSERLRPTDRRERGGTEAFGLVDLELRGDPAPQQERREPCVLDRAHRTRDAEPIAPDGVGRLVAAREPHRLADARAALVPSDRTDVEHRRPPIELDRRVDAERTLDGDRRRDPREHRVEHPMLVHAPPPDRQQERARERERERRPHRPVLSDRRRRDRGPEIACSRRDEPGALEGRQRLRAAGRERQRRPQQPAADRQPDPRVDEFADPRLHQQAGPEHGRERRCDPGAHTVTRSRMFSSVASPIPLTSSSWSTEVNGPFSVR